MIGNHPCVDAISSLARSALRSTTLLVFSPMHPQYIPRSFPPESLIAPPTPAKPGLPLAAPSKFNLKIDGGGGSQISGLLFEAMFILVGLM